VVVVVVVMGVSVSVGGVADMHTIGSFRCLSREMW